MKICPVCSTQYSDDVKFCSNDGQTLRAAAPTTDLVGQVVADRYHVIKKLGEGGMGQVYLAEHVKMGRRSAIKVMNPSMVHDPDAVARFNREASNASRITHPNVCAIYDFGETSDGLIYLAMEFIEGEPLTDLLEREGALPVPRASAIFLQVAEALQAAHDLGIVHRDLKPDNIMLSRGRDHADVVKVVDFGIAKAVGGDEAGQKVTKTGLVVGTPEFMSPEQLSGDKLDGRSDLYSLALVYYKTLTGELPFAADTVQETMIKRLTDDPKPLAATRPDLSFPPGLQEVFDAALTRSPVDRYQSVAKFANDVAGVVGTVRGGAAVVPSTRADVEGKTQLLDTSATKAMAAKAPPRGAPAAAPAKRRSLVPLIVGAVVLLGAGGGAAVMLGGGGTKSDSTALRPDSTRLAANSADTGRHGTVPLSQRTTPPAPGNPRGADSSARPPATPRVILAQIGTALDTLLDKVDNDPTGVRDSAQVFFNAPGISTKDKAMAAFVIANTYPSDKTRACDWYRRAAALDPADPTYTQVARTQCQD